MIGIIDYNMGNLQSIYNAFVALEEEAEIIKNPKKLRDVDAIVLPGVGAFADGMYNLKQLGFIEILRDEIINNKKPYLGICLGLQFLCEFGYEHGKHEGLKFIEGDVIRIEPKLKEFKVPHMGWNNIKFKRDSILFQGHKDNPDFYFVHSYHFDVKNKEYISSTVDHGIKLVSSIQKDNIFGVQFHPEKSLGAGLRLLNNFIGYVKNA